MPATSVAPAALSASVAPGLASVLVVDDHQVLASALAGALAGAPGFGEVRTAHSVPAATAELVTLQPTLAVIDVMIGDESGLVLLQRLPELSPDTRAVVLSGHLRRDVVQRAHALGAWAALPKGMGLAELLGVLGGVLAGHRLAAPEDACAADLLTGREIEILQYLAWGHDPARTARLLALSEHTVRDHIKSARTKLDVQSQLAAVMVAIGRGLVEPPQR